MGVEMDVKRRLGLLLAGTVLGTSILVSAPAFADDAQLQQQINAMQRQLQAMQDQLAETKKQAKAAAQQAQQTQQAQQQQAQNIPANISPNLYAADVPIPTKGPPSWFDSIHVSMAGTFVAMEGAWRQRNENSSGPHRSAPSRS
jgi:TolA-binding protein